MNVTVRAARPADESDLFALAASFPTPTPPSLEVFGTLFRLKLDDPTSGLFVAELDQRLVGYVSGSSRLAFYAAGATAWVDEILVVTEHRRGSIGTQLMTAFEQWAATQRCVVIALATRGAGPFYEHLGYASSAAYFKKCLS